MKIKLIRKALKKLDQTKTTVGTSAYITHPKLYRNKFGKIFLTYKWQYVNPYRQIVRFIRRENIPLSELGELV